MNTSITPLQLGDIFDRTFKLIGSTVVRNLIIGAVFLIPAGLFLAIGLDIFFTSIGGLLQSGPTDPEAMGNPLVLLGGSLLAFFLFLGLYALASYAATLGITTVACAEFSAEPMSWEDSLRVVFSTRYLKALGQIILQFLTYAGIFLLPYMMIIGAAASDVPVLGILGFLLMMLAVILVLYISNRWSFALQAIAWEDAGVLEALRRSWDLVRGNWWRVFGILLLFSIILQFALSILLAPVYLVAFWGLISDFIRMASLEGGPPDMDAIVAALDSISIRVTAVAFFSSILTLLITPLYTSILYFDLRARAGEFRRRTAAVQEAPPSEESGPLPLP
jgi:hypothetical protein